MKPKLRIAVDKTSIILQFYEHINLKCFHLIDLSLLKVSVAKKAMGYASINTQRKGLTEAIGNNIRIKLKKSQDPS